jgi:hypothetical protein
MSELPKVTPLREDEAKHQELKDVPDENGEPPLPDASASKEEDAIRKDSYAEDGKKKDHERQHGIKNVVYHALKLLIFFGVLTLTRRVMFSNCPAGHNAGALVISFIF